MIAKEAIAQAAQALEDTARGHKRASSYHRKQARLARENLSRLKEVALKMGIKIVIKKAEASRHG